MYRSTRPSTSVADDAREEKLQNLIRQMSEGVAAAAASPEAWRASLKHQAAFHQYSYGNQMLILMQRPSATQVAGFKAWLDHGRYVRKGEKGIAVLAPTTIVKEMENEDGTKERKPVLVGFHIVYVFDAAQTEVLPGAKDRVPSVREVPGAGETYAALKRFSEGRGYRVEEHMTGDSEGYCDYHNRLIVVGAEPDPVRRVGILAHEVAHSILHEVDRGQRSRGQREMEAESAAFVVLGALGLEDSREWSSFHYVAEWNPKPAEILQAGDRIAKAARLMLAAVLGTERGQEEAA